MDGRNYRVEVVGSNGAKWVSVVFSTEPFGAVAVAMSQFITSAGQMDNPPEAYSVKCYPLGSEDIKRPLPEPHRELDSVDREVQQVFRSLVAKFADLDTLKEPCGVGTAISTIYDAIDKVARSAQLSPGQAREVVAIVGAAFEYGAAKEAYRQLIKDWM